MILKKTIPFLALISVFMFSCKEDGKKDTKLETPQMKEVMAIHDEVMPRMSTIGKLVGELKPKIDSTETGMQYEAAMKDLQEAHKGMMEWMQDFGDTFDSDEILNGKALSEEKQKLLDAEETKIKEVRNAINSSIEKAETLLKEE